MSGERKGVGCLMGEDEEDRVNYILGPHGLVNK